MTDRTAAEVELIRDVAARYAAMGYSVVVDPPIDDLPEALRGYRPDLVARRQGEAVLVEVERDPSGSALARYRDFAARVQEQPGWRLDLVVVNAPDRVPGAAAVPVLPLEDIHRRYGEAEDLLTGGHPDAALLLAWASTEGALRRIAEDNAVDAQRSSTPALLKQLVTLGVISRAQYDVLWDSYRERNAVAHGFAGRERQDTTRSVISLGRDLLTEFRHAA